MRSGKVIQLPLRWSDKDTGQQGSGNRPQRKLAKLDPAEQIADAQRQKESELGMMMKDVDEPCHNWLSLCRSRLRGLVGLVVTPRNCPHSPPDVVVDVVIKVGK
jgi:hypothetical protein